MTTVACSDTKTGCDIRAGPPYAGPPYAAPVREAEQLAIFVPYNRPQDDVQKLKGNAVACVGLQYSSYGLVGLD